jgi:hypothetical protein
MQHITEPSYRQRASMVSNLSVTPVYGGSRHLHIIVSHGQNSYPRRVSGTPTLALSGFYYKISFPSQID